MRHINDLYAGIFYQSMFITFVFLVVFIFSFICCIKSNIKYKNSTGLDKVSNEFNRDMSGLICGLSLIGLGVGIIFCFNVSNWFI